MHVESVASKLLNVACVEIKIEVRQKKVRSACLPKVEKEMTSPLKSPSFNYSKKMQEWHVEMTCCASNA